MVTALVLALVLTALCLSGWSRWLAARVAAPQGDVAETSAGGDVVLRAPFRHTLSASLIGFAAPLAARAGIELRANPLENPARPLTDPALLGLLGGQPTTSGTSVTEESSLTIGAVWRAVSLISGTIGALGLEVTEVATRKRVVVRALNRWAPGEMTPFELWETIVVHLLLWGNAYVVKIRDASGRIVQLVPVHPGRVRVEIDQSSPVGPVKVFLVADLSGTKYEPYTTYDLMHVPGLNYDGIAGLAPIRLNREMLGVAKSAELLAAKLYGNGNLLSGILTTQVNLDKEQSDRLKTQWREKMSGLTHAYDIAVLDNGAEFKSLTMPLADAQWLEARTFQVEEIARWFGVPPSMLGEVSKHASQGGGNGIETQNLAFVQHTLTPWLSRIEQRIRAEVLSNPIAQEAKFNLAGLLRGDMAARFQAYSIAVGQPFMAGNEARLLENLEPVPGLDDIATASAVGAPNDATAA